MDRYNYVEIGRALHQIDISILPLARSSPESARTFVPESSQLADQKADRREVAIENAASNQV